MGISLRRHHRRRLIKKVEWYYGGNHLGSPWNKEQCAKIINSRQKCSCPLCCGNPRRIKGRNVITKQEVKAGVSGYYRS